MHVRGAAEFMLERGREDDDGDFGAARAEAGGDCGAEFAGAEVVVEHGDVDLVDQGHGLFDGGGGFGLIAVLAEDGGAKVEICRLVIEQEDANGSGVAGDDLQARRLYFVFTHDRLDSWRAQSSDAKYGAASCLWFSADRGSDRAAY
jgi:hypothetical protein